jgi:hypothetical protein
MHRVRTGKLGLARANMNKVCLRHFEAWLGPATAVTVISEAERLDWFHHLSAQVQKGIWKASHCDRIFSTSRRFVRFLWELRLVELPRNLESRNLSFVVGPEKRLRRQGHQRPEGQRHHHPQAEQDQEGGERADRDLQAVAEDLRPAQAAPLRRRGGTLDRERPAVDHGAPRRRVP